MSTESVIHLADLSSINKAAIDLLNLCKNHFFFAFYGSMGVGKTTFIKALCKELDCLDTVSSPTYSIINEYQTTEDSQLIHMDLYRLNDLEEALDAGVEEYLDQKNTYCFIEWPGLIEEILPKDTVTVQMEMSTDDQRTLRIKYNG